MKLPGSPTYYRSLQLYTSIISTRGSVQSVTLEKASLGTYEREDSGATEWKVQQAMSIVERGLLSSLSTAALKLAIKVMDDLKMNNALWWVDVSSPHTRSAIKQLKDREILIPTEDKNIFYVNPMLIRRGSVGSVLAQTTKVLEGISRVHKTLIKDLNYKVVKFNQFDQLNLPTNGSHL